MRLSSHDSIKNLHNERQTFLTRVLLMVMGCLLLSVILAVRLLQLQVLQHDYYQVRSDENRMQLTVVPPVRGLIYDRNGALLVQNVPSFVLEIVPEKAGDLDALFHRLSSVVALTEADRSRFRERMKKSSRFRGVPLRSNLSMEEVARFQINRHEYQGVDIAAGLTRNYVLGRSAAHVIGYIGGITEENLKEIDERAYRGTNYIGRTGVERSHEDLLHGTVGTKIVETNAGGRPLRELDYRRGAPGQNLLLSLDARLQLASEHALGDRNGAVVAIAPESGEVLALVSKPGFDPHQFVEGIDREAFRQLNLDTAHPLFNRALQGQYSPGSTIKPLMALAALHHGTKSPQEREFCTGEFNLPNVKRKYRCWRREGHGWLDMSDGISKSCDVYFYQLALTLGIDRIQQFLSDFGLGRPTGLDLPGEKSGLLPSRDWKRRARRESWYPGETLNIGIGQGYLTMTPLQMAQMTALIAQRGAGFKPHIVHALQDPVTGNITPVEPEPLPPVMVGDRQDWERVIAAMEEVAHDPAGTAFRVGRTAPYRIAAKTGTVQIIAMSQEDEKAIEQKDVAEHLRDHALFIAFAPSDAPRIAIAVLVENAGGGGGAIAGPIARQVMDTYLLQSEPAP